MTSIIAPIPLASLHLSVRPEPHAFSAALQGAIAESWAALTDRTPALFNGSAFLFDRIDINTEAGTLVAEAAPTDYATFLFWRANRERFPFHHVFPVGAILTADRRLIVGRMSDHTANPGKLYPPAGSFDASDLTITIDGLSRLDPDANIRREIAEEIGLDTGDLDADSGWLLLPSTRNAHALVRCLKSRNHASQLLPALRRHIAEDPAQELAGIDAIAFSDRLPEPITMPYVNHLLAYLDAKA